MFEVLIVEDNKIFRELLRDELLLNFPYIKVLEAASGEEAMKGLEQHCPRLIFLDIRLLGDENGLQIARKIRQASHSDPVIAMLTGYALPEYEKAAKECGIDFFLKKGVSTQTDIVAVVESTLAFLGDESLGRLSH